MFACLCLPDSARDGETRTYLSLRRRGWLRWRGKACLAAAWRRLLVRLNAQVAWRAREKLLTRCWRLSSVTANSQLAAAVCICFLVLSSVQTVRGWPPTLRTQRNYRANSSEPLSNSRLAARAFIFALMGRRQADGGCKSANGTHSFRFLSLHFASLAVGLSCAPPWHTVARFVAQQVFAGRWHAELRSAGQRREGGRADDRLCRFAQPRRAETNRNQNQSRTEAD